MTRIFPISGFRETARRWNGMERMTRDIIAPYDDRADVDVVPLQIWKADWKGMAARAKRHQVTAAIIVGYSWGGGYGAQRLAAELEAQGIPVELMLLCDPVYRPTWLPTWLPANVFGFRALMPRAAKIRVPDSVQRVKGIRQSENLPMGHKLLWRGLTVSLDWVGGVRHTTIDDSSAWRRLVETEFQTHLGKP